jgi:predicted short-subunit dehydrogenase-like oxidoreductase (DUF2520 family)
MRQPPTLGLWAAGPVSKSFVARIPFLRDSLGPVMGEPYRVASRMVNTLRAGYPVQDIAELGACHLLLIYLPDAEIPMIAERLAHSEIDWGGKVVLLCNSGLDSGALSPLTNLGAHTGSVMPLAGFEEVRFIAEGDRSALGAIRRLLQREEVKVVPLHSMRKVHYLAALTLPAGLLTPLADACTQLFCYAGMKPKVAQKTTERLLQQSLRTYMNAGRKSWSGPLAQGEQEILLAHREALRKVSRLLEAYYAGAAAASWRLMGLERSWEEIDGSGAESKVDAQRV